MTAVNFGEFNVNAISRYLTFNIQYSTLYLSFVHGHDLKGSHFSGSNMEHGELLGEMAVQSKQPLKRRHELEETSTAKRVRVLSDNGKQITVNIQIDITMIELVYLATT